MFKKTRKLILNLLAEHTSYRVFVAGNTVNRKVLIVADEPAIKNLLSLVRKLDSRRVVTANGRLNPSTINRKAFDTAILGFLFEQARPSPVKACNENPDYYAANPYWSVVLEALAIDESVPVTPVQSEIADLVTEAVDEVWFGVTTPQEALNWAHEQTQPILDKFWSGA